MDLDLICGVHKGHVQSREKWAYQHHKVSCTSHFMLKSCENCLWTPQLGTENQYFLADLTHNSMLLWINLVIIVVKESGY